MPDIVPVTVDNFTRAETDRYFAGVARANGFGRLDHRRELVSVDRQDVVRMNRDTLYSAGVFDLDAGPLTITLPDPGGRFMSLQVIDEDEYTHEVIYEPGAHRITRAQIGTRYVLAAVRIFVDPAKRDDLAAVHALQDAIRVEQPATGRFEVPRWDEAGQSRLRDALAVLGATLPDSRGMFGGPREVDPVHFLIGSATAWGGNPERDAKYLTVHPPRNDGVTPHALTVRDVPVDGFWSISVYGADGYFAPNERNVWSVNGTTAVRDADGSVRVQFGGCDGATPNCLPITPGWNYVVRLYRPREEILRGAWRFPDAEPIG